MITIDRSLSKTAQAFQYRFECEDSRSSNTVLESKMPLLLKKVCRIASVLWCISTASHSNGIYCLYSCRSCPQPLLDIRSLTRMPLPSTFSFCMDTCCYHFYYLKGNGTNLTGALICIAICSNFRPALLANMLSQEPPFGIYVSFRLNPAHCMQPNAGRT